MTFYEAHEWGTIKEVNVDRVSEKSVWVKYPSGSIARMLRDDGWRTFHETREQALRWVHLKCQDLIIRSERALEDARDRVELARRNLADFEAEHGF